MKLNIELDSARAREALAKAPEVMNRHLSRSLDRAAEEVAREERSAAPKAFSNLVNSIRVVKEGELSRIIAPGVNYARAVEEGTKPGTMPPRESLVAWIKQKSFAERVSIYGPRRPRKFSNQNKAHTDELRDRSFALALHIKLHGTKAQPFVKPTAEKMRGRVLALLREGVDRGVQEILG